MITLDDASTISLGVNSNTITYTAVLAPVHYAKVSGHCNYWDSSKPLNQLISNGGGMVTSDYTSCSLHTAAIDA